MCSAHKTAILMPFHALDFQLLTTVHAHTFQKILKALKCENILSRSISLSNQLWIEWWNLFEKLGLLNHVWQYSRKPLCS